MHTSESKKKFTMQYSALQQNKVITCFQIYCLQNKKQIWQSVLFNVYYIFLGIKLKR